MSSRHRQWKAIRRFLIGGTLFALALLVGFELSAGSWFGDRRLNDLVILRYADKYNDVSQFFDEAGGEVRFRTNAYGLRGEPQGLSRVDMMTVGSSTTLQELVPEEKTWQQVIENRFKTAGPHPVSVLNAGVDGQTTQGAIRDFDSWFPLIPGLKARYVLVYLGIDELLIVQRELAYTIQMDGVMARSTWKHYIATHSATYFLARRLVNTWKNSVMHGGGSRKVARVSVSWTDEPVQTDHAGLLRAKLDGYVERLRILEARIRAFGATPIFVVEPEGVFRFEGARVLGRADTIDVDGRFYNGVDVYRAMGLLSKRTRAFCAERGLAFFDVGHDVRFEQADFYDFRHNTPAGSRKIGEYLYTRLKDLL